MKRRLLTLLGIELLLVAAALLDLAWVLNPRALYPRLWPSDPEAVVSVMTRFYLTVVFLWSVLPYLVGSLLAEWLPSFWRLIVVVGMVVYVMIMLPQFGATGPHSGLQNFEDKLCIVPFIGFPLLLTGKVVWLVFWRRVPVPGFCSVCGYDLRASKDKCPECGEAIRPA